MTSWPLRSRVTTSSVGGEQPRRRRRRRRRVVASSDLDPPRARGDGLLQRRRARRSTGGRGCTSRPTGRAGVEPGGQRRRRRRSAPSAQVDVEVLGQRLVAGGQGQPEVQLGPGREPLGVGDGQLGPAQRPLPDAGDVAVAGEADLAQLGEPEADAHQAGAALDRAGDERRPARRRRCRGPGRCPGCRRPAAWPRRRRARCRSRCRRRSRSRASSGSPSRPTSVEGVPPVLPEEVLVQPGREVVPRAGPRPRCGGGGRTSRRRGRARPWRRARARGRSARTTPGTCRRGATRPR